MDEDQGTEFSPVIKPAEVGGDAIEQLTRDKKLLQGVVDAKLIPLEDFMIMGDFFGAARDRIMAMGYDPLLLWPEVARAIRDAGVAKPRHNVITIPADPQAIVVKRLELLKQLRDLEAAERTQSFNQAAHPPATAADLLKDFV